MSLLRPHLKLKSVLDLEPARLQELGLQSLLMDVDCTLKDYRAPELNLGVPEWIESLKAGGIQLCLLSNGRRRRIEPLAKQFGMECVAMAFKPLPFGCWGALKKLRAEPAQTAVVGDQVFADIMAGRMAGLFTILVCPTTTVEPWFTRCKRPVERRLLAWMDARSAIPTIGFQAGVNGTKPSGAS